MIILLYFRFVFLAGCHGTMQQIRVVEINKIYLLSILSGSFFFPFCNLVFDGSLYLNSGRVKYWRKRGLTHLDRSHSSDFLSMHNAGSLAFSFLQMVKLTFVKSCFSRHRCWRPACLLYIRLPTNQLFCQILTKLELGTFWLDMGWASLACSTIKAFKQLWASQW